MAHIVKHEIYKIIKSDKSGAFKEVVGTEVIVLNFVSDYHSNKTIICPLNYQEYDKYFKWLYKECIFNNMTISDTYEDFKIEVVNDAEVLPSIFDEYLSEFEYVREYNEQDMKQHFIDFEKYFKEAIEAKDN